MAHPPSRLRFPRRSSSSTSSAYDGALAGGAPPRPRSITGEASSRSPPCRMRARWSVACPAR
eukprot:4845708-Pyramimonas_sp.AAC.1